MIDFDEVIDRRDTHSQKWDELEKGYGVSPDGGIPLWVADMDFRAPPPVNEALQQMVDHGIHGYYGDDSSFRAAMAGWMKRRHGWTIEPDWALQTHGLVNAIAMVIQACSAPGEGVIIFSPVYHAFARIINANGRRMVASPLRVEDNRFHMDIEALEASLTGDERILLLCSPHNPGGRVWSAGELRDVAAFCERNDIILVSDEVHHDLVMPGHSHHITACVAPEDLRQACHSGGDKQDIQHCRDRDRQHADFESDTPPPGGESAVGDVDFQQPLRNDHGRGGVSGRRRVAGQPADLS